MMQHVSINGRLVTRAQARVSVADGGFLHGEGLFETIRLYAARPLFLDSHLDRLRAGARLLGLACPPARTFRREVNRVVRANRVRDDAVCRISLSRAPSRRPRPRGEAAATRVILLRPLPEDIARATERGVHARTLRFDRAAGPSAAVKSLSYLPSILALRAADLAGAAEAVFISADDQVLEGATTNVFARVGDVLVTPPADGRILPGVMRGRLIALGGGGLPPIKEAPLPFRDLAEAPEVFLTNAIREVVPVTRLDGRRIGGGRPGPFTRSLQEACRAAMTLPPSRRPKK
ncbi:MAG: aminotransferase class IV [Myxococcota bacterium]